MITAIIVAAGKGERMKNKINKPLLHLAGKPMLYWTLKSFVDSSVDNILIVANPAEIEDLSALIAEHAIEKVLGILPGGEKRQDSVSNGLDFLPDQTEVVAVHDGARPLITPEHIDKLIADLKGYDGVVPAVKPIDTIKVARENTVDETLDRQNLRAIQTPQIFKRKPLVESYAKAKSDGFYGTDDASLLERYGYSVKISEGSYDNIKITNPVDLELAEVIIAKKIK